MVYRPATAGGTDWFTTAISLLPRAVLTGLPLRSRLRGGSNLKLETQRSQISNLKSEISNIKLSIIERGEGGNQSQLKTHRPRHQVP